MQLFPCISIYVEQGTKPKSHPLEEVPEPSDLESDFLQVVYMHPMFSEPQLEYPYQCYCHGNSDRILEVNLPRNHMPYSFGPHILVFLILCEWLHQSQGQFQSGFSFHGFPC
uniref:Uncharacterized protein n=1 Tax=Opuntia streptacantha TaxID=393608 RepID=A0A7C9B1D5_OPUST